MPPTRRSPLGVPCALAPWQTAHFAANTCAPCATEPEPAGRPVPSGGMLISALAISSGVAGRPSFGGAMSAARAVVAMTLSSVAARSAPLTLPCRAAFDSHSPRATSPASGGANSLDIDVAHLAVGGNGPALNCVEVEILARRILRDPLRTCRLDLSFLVGGTAHQDCRSATPHPGQP